MISSKSVSEDCILDLQILPKNTALSVKYVEKFRLKKNRKNETFERSGKYILGKFCWCRL